MHKTWAGNLVKGKRGLAQCSSKAIKFKEPDDEILLNACSGTPELIDLTDLNSSQSQF